MGAARHLSRAPIVEALIQISVVLPPGTDLQAAVTAHRRIEGDYPKTRKRFRGELRIDVSQGLLPSVEPSPATVGYLYLNEQETRIAQFNADSFSFNWLKPYETWEAFRDAARAIWPVYLDALKPITVTRIGLRYINDLAIPLSIASFDEVLSAPPTVPEGLPQAISSYFDRAVIEDTKRGAGAIIMRTIESQPKNGVLPVILDVDVFKDGAFEAASGEIWDVLEMLHDFKNEVFFRSITRKLEETYL